MFKKKISRGREKRRQGNAESTADDQEMVIGVGWYNSENYKRILQISEDRSNLFEQYSDWLLDAESKLYNFQSRGVGIEKVYIDPDELLSWCREQGLAVDARSRADFVSWKVREKYEGENCK